MIEESGVIVRLDGDFALVQTERRSSCGGCGAAGSCGTSLLDRFLGRRPVLLAASNRASAGLGDRVVVGVDESDLLRAVAATYLVPVAALVVGVVLGQVLARVSGLPSNLLALLGGAGALTLALWRLHRYSAGLEAVPVVLRLVATAPASEAVAPPDSR